jgi:hypothetical protein
MTSLEVIYDAFLAKILEDEWETWDVEEDIVRDWRAILDGALPWFKFPRVDLTIKDDSFVGDLSNEEIQIIACRMKCEWLNRNILTWENIKSEYEERDFSQANLIDKLTGLLDREENKAADLERVYYRSIKGSPFKYRKLAGDSYV